MAVLEPKASTEVRDYRFDWSAFLGSDTIATSDVTVTGATLNSETNDDTSATYWISGGTSGTVARIVNTITTAGGRTETEVHTLAIRDVSEPVSLSIAKAHLRVLDDNEDAIIASYIAAAREWVENYTGHILVRRSITQSFSGFTPYLQLHYRPIIEVTGFSYTDPDGAVQELADYAQTTGRYPFRIYPDERPSIADYSTVDVTFVAGYAEGEQPQELIQAMLLLIEGMFSNRGTIPEATLRAAESLCNHHRVAVI